MFADTPGASFIVPPLSIPARDWIGVRLIEGASEVNGVCNQDVRRFDTDRQLVPIHLRIFRYRLPLTGLTCSHRPPKCACLCPRANTASSLDEI